MRFSAIALLAAASCAAPEWAGRHADQDGKDTLLDTRPNIEAAREMDQEGVRAFQEGRYADSTRYFRAAYRLGAPASELWNMARSLERLDDPAGAVGAIEAYLARRGQLSSQDRADAERELQTLRGRPSPLTVTTFPAAATVSLDAKRPLGSTPLTTEIPAGPHTIVVRRDGYVAVTRSVEARFGRAIIVALDLARAGGWP
jgi:PEGA domain